jgi:hypothetical protein
VLNIEVVYPIFGRQHIAPDQRKGLSPETLPQVGTWLGVPDTLSMEETKRFIAYIQK